MAVEKSYARLGLFLVVVLVVVLATAFLFIQRWRSRAVIAMVTYTGIETISNLAEEAKDYGIIDRVIAQH